MSEALKVMSFVKQAVLTLPSNMPYVVVATPPHNTDLAFSDPVEAVWYKGSLHQARLTNDRHAELLKATATRRNASYHEQVCTVAACACDLTCSDLGRSLIQEHRNNGSGC